MHSNHPATTRHLAAAAAEGKQPKMKSSTSGTVNKHTWFAPVHAYKQGVVAVPYILQQLGSATIRKQCCVIVVSKPQGHN
jgi:hypothetical protein